MTFHNGRILILTILMMGYGLTADAQAQIDVNETGLHDGASACGLRVVTTDPSYTNSENIALQAWGETDPSLYTIILFDAYGLYSDIDLTNTGSVDVNAVGGDITSNGYGFSGPVAYGIYGTIAANVDNYGSLTVATTGGTTTAVDEAQAYAYSHGIQAVGDISNAGVIAATTTAGSAESDTGLALAYGFAYGIFSYGDGNVNNTAAITAAAEGGHAIAERKADAYSYAYGIDSPNDIDNTGNLTVTATAGTSDANSASVGYAYSEAFAYGINGKKDISNTGDSMVNAEGGNAISEYRAYANSSAYGLYVAGVSASGDVDNAGALTVEAAGGTATGHDDVDADADGYGIHTGRGDVSNTGAIDVNATGGTATAHAGSASAVTHAYGVYAGAGDVNNIGDIAVVATGGTADGNDPRTLAASVADAQGTAYGVYATEGLITNGGQINVSASGGTVSSTSANEINTTSASGRAYGLCGGDGAIENTGSVIVAATGGSATSSTPDVSDTAAASAWAYGLYLNDTIDDIYSYTDRHVSNSGNLVVTATGASAEALSRAASASASAYGIQSEYAPVANSGHITATAIGGNAQSTSAYIGGEPRATANANAYGIESDNAGVENHGNVTAQATGGTATGQNAATSEASAYVRGISVWGRSSNLEAIEVQTDGPITAIATGGTAEAVADDAKAYSFAYGLHASQANVNNLADINVISQGGNATTGQNADAYADAYAEGYGLFVTGVDSGGDASNSGNITVHVTAGTAVPGEGLVRDYARAVGIYAGTADVLNRGDVTITAVEGSDGGAGLSGAYAIIANGAVINNSGAVTATATSGIPFAGRAYGIYSSGATSLTNTGIIRASADSASEVYVTGGTTTLVDTYNITLDRDSNEGSLRIADEATLALNSATLTASGVSGETLWDTPYRVFETEGAGVVDGNFADVQSASPNARVTYYDQGTAGSTDDTVALSYAPVAATSSHSAGVERQIVFQTTDAVNRRMTGAVLQNLLSPGTSPLLASAGSTDESLTLVHSAPKKKSTGVFFEPFYSRLDQEADPLGYTAKASGFAVGYEQAVENTLLSLHAGYGQSDIHYSGAGYNANLEDQDVVTAGLSGLTRRDPWTLRYGLTGFFGWHDYTGVTGFNLDERETASYNSYGAAATVMAGRLFRCKGHTFLPEAGLNYIWAHRDSYTTAATDPTWNTTYSDLDDHDVQAEAALRWLSSFMHGNMHVTPSVSVGVRHLLTDAESSAWLSVPGATPVLVTSQRDRTALTLSGSLVVNEDKRAVSLAYDGEYADDSQRHSVWLRLSWLF